MKVRTNEIKTKAADYSYYALMATKTMNNNFQNRNTQTPSHNEKFQTVKYMTYGHSKQFKILQYTAAAASWDINKRAHQQTNPKMRKIIHTMLTWQPRA